MVIGIHPDRSGKESYSDRWADQLRKRGVSVRILDLLGSDAITDAARCDGVMARFLHNPHQKQSVQRVLSFVERYVGIPVFPDAPTSWHYDEKVLQHYLLKHLDAPVPQTWVFWRKEDALAWARSAPYPVVLKLSAGASAQNVILVHDETGCRKWIDRMFGRGVFPLTVHHPNRIREWLGLVRCAPGRLVDGLRYIWRGEFPPVPDRWWKPEYGYIYFQEFLAGNGFDTRVTTIGDRAFAYRRLNRPNDFRASGSGRNLVDPAGIDKECVKIAFEISRRGDFQCMSYDFLYKQGRPVINEISYTTVDRYVYDSPGHWDSDLGWHEGSMWPEEAQADDFIQRVLAWKQSRRSAVNPAATPQVSPAPQLFPLSVAS